MRHTKVEPSSFLSIVKYFSAFEEERKSKKNNVTLRSISLRLNWSPSFLPSIIAGKRKLTIRRAIEWSQHFGFNSFETTHFIQLTLSEMSSEMNEKEFFTKQVKDSYNAKAEICEPTSIASNFFERLDDIFIMFIIKKFGSLIDLRKFKPTTPLVDRCLINFPTRISNLQKEGLVETILDAKLQSVDPSIIKYENQDFQKTAMIHTKYSDNTRSFCNNFSGKEKTWTLLTSGFVWIPKSKKEDIRKELLLVRERISQISQEASKDEDLLAASEPCQYDINLFPLLIDTQN
jgi:hypothetical protein